MRHKRNPYTGKVGPDNKHGLGCLVVFALFVVLVVSRCTAPSEPAPPPEPLASLYEAEAYSPPSDGHLQSLGTSQSSYRANQAAESSAIEARAAYNPDPAPQVQYVPDPPGQTQNDSDYYTNVDGNQVQTPHNEPTGCAASGATAQCRDGTCSFSQHHQGTCSRHGGVAEWM